MKEIRASVRIRGVVQGVSFRYHTRRTAENLGVRGWVRNLPNGDVEGVFEGKDSQVRELVNWCRKGPEGARVEKLFIDWEEPTGEFEDFRVVR